MYLSDPGSYPGEFSIMNAMVIHSFHVTEDTFIKLDLMILLRKRLGYPKQEMEGVKRVNSHHKTFWHPPGWPGTSTASSGHYAVRRPTTIRKSLAHGCWRGRQRPSVRSNIHRWTCRTLRKRPEKLKIKKYLNL